MSQTYNLSCEQCSVEFSSKYKTKKTCSSVCKSSREKIRTGRHSINRERGISNSTVGAVTEMKVAAEMLLLGYSVFRAASPACFADMILHKNNRIIVLEIRTGYKSTTTGNILFPTKLRGTGIDYYAVYEKIENKIYFFDMDLNECDLK